MDIKITKFKDKYVDEMAQLFTDAYSEQNRKWDLNTAKKYLLRDVRNSPEYCLVALDETGKCIGGVFCRKDPYYTGDMLFIDSVQTKPEYRKKGVAKKLLSEVLNKAKSDGMTGAHLLADSREGFPRSWYEGIGFELSGWAEYEVEWDKLKLRFD